MNEIIELGKVIKGANVAAINRAAKTTVTQTSSFIRERYNFKKKDLDEHIKIISKATNEFPFVKVLVKRPDISLLKFDAKQFGTGGRRKRKGPRGSQGVKATVIKGKRQLFRSKDKTRGSFIWKDDSVERGVFIRTGEKHILTKGKHIGKEREGIRKLYGVNLISLFDPKAGKSKLLTKMQQIFENEYSKRLEHELTHRISSVK